MTGPMRGTSTGRDLAAQIRRSGRLADAATALQVRAASAVANARDNRSAVAARHGRRPRPLSVDRMAPDPGRPEVILRVSTLSGLHTARQRIGRAAARAGLADRLVTNLVLAVQELMTNTIRHGGGWGDVRLHRDGPLLVCVVSDRGPGLPGDLRQFGLPAGADPESGRGLFLARQLTDDMSVATSPAGLAVTVTMDLRIPAGECTGVG